jgi:hypothetical protein
MRTGLNIKNLNDAKNLLSYADYKALKHEYRTSGFKANLPVKQGAVEFTEYLYRNGFENVALTSRPFDEYPSLRMLTKMWLDKNKFRYDDLVYSSHKHLDILAQYPQLSFMVEDNRDFANKIAAFGYRVYLMDNSYNQGELHSNVKRIKSFDEIIKELEAK